MIIKFIHVLVNYGYILISRLGMLGSTIIQVHGVLLIIYGHML